MIASYNIHGRLGQSVFSETLLARRAGSIAYVAIKKISKRDMREDGRQKNVEYELKALMSCNERNQPYVSTFIDALQTSDAVFIVKDYASRGDLQRALHSQPFTEAQTRFYAAEICHALRSLHDCDVLHRNITLDNILLGDDGHIILAGFGSCKTSMTGASRTSTFVGGGLQAPPEVLLGQPYGHPADWWSFGVVLHEMLVQEPPFHGENEEALTDAILSNRRGPFAIHLPVGAADILDGLLKNNPTERLGDGTQGYLDVLSHPYFAIVDWDAISRKAIPPPLMPGHADIPDQEFCATVSGESHLTFSAGEFADFDSVSLNPH